MDLFDLDAVEARVLGALMEKEMATPDYYPLTLNALTAACNQKSNRDPVMALEEADVAHSLEQLRRRGLTRQAAEGGRVPKYSHNVEGKFHLEPPEQALLCLLLLRGAQTLGELRSRSDRLHTFDELEQVEAVLDELMDRDQPLVVRLPRQPGRKEHRYLHLLSGEPELQEGGAEPPPERATVQVRADAARLQSLEEEVKTLRAEMESLQEEFKAFRAQFE